MGSVGGVIVDCQLVGILDNFDYWVTELVVPGARQLSCRTGPPRLVGSHD